MVDAPARIKPLEISVVNRIAAGEIIIGPSNALKEIMENSVDAKSTSIDILVKEGGTKLLQITDNGTGIAKEDLEILCERFTTSKLQKFEDLSSIATYGFRGEALASISHISHLSVTTKTRDSPCAWRCAYNDGKMVPLKPKTQAEPKAVAGKDGTQITVEDLFYNVPSRLRSLKSNSEEFGKIVDVVGRYAVHTEGVGFSCKKMDDTFSAVTTRAGTSRKDRIRTVFGPSVANELISVEIEPEESLGLVKCYGDITNSNYLNKKSIQPVFFINNRLVSCDPLKRAINAMYTVFLPKGSKPFVYLALEIDPKNVDVNVHPTKREVRFLHEDEIIEHVVSRLQQQLTEVDSTRLYVTQQVLPNAKRLKMDGDEDARFTPTKNYAKVYDYNLVRTDASQSKITAFVRREEKTEDSELVEDVDEESVEADVVESDEDEEQADEAEVDLPEEQAEEQQEPDILEDVAVIDAEEEAQASENSEDMDIDATGLERDDAAASESASDAEPDAEPEAEADAEPDAEPEAEPEISAKQVAPIGRFAKREKVNVKLSSVLELRQQIESNTHRQLTEIFAKHSFVGVVDQERRLAAIQHDVRLYLVDYAAVFYELFYQIGASDFCNFGRIHLGENGISVKKLLESAAENGQFLSNYKDVKVKSAKDALEVFGDMRDMFEEYFSMVVEGDGDDLRLVSVPLLLEGYVPPMSKLPYFVFRLVNKINWEDEKECLEGILRQIALLYIPESSKAEIDKKQQDVFENVLFPALKRRFLAPQSLKGDVVEIANLPGLYKVFERC